MLANSVDCHTTSNPSRMRYYVMLSHWMSVMFSWASHICGNTMLSMSLDPVVSLLLWGVISTGYQRQFQLLPHRNSATRQYLILQNSSSPQFVQRVNKRILQPPQLWPKHLLSNRSRSTRLQQSEKIPPAHYPLMQPNLLNNLSLNKFVTNFHKLSSATSPARQAAHQDADSTNAFPSPPGTQHNGDHCLLMNEY